MDLPIYVFHPQKEMRDVTTVSEARVAVSFT
jgi:hypothetical protein